MNTAKYDLVIIGAGVAGLSAAGYGARANLKVLVIELGGSGGQAQNIVSLENYPGVYPAISGYEFIENMKKQAISFGAEINNTEVLSLDKKNDVFVLKTSTQEITATSLLLATGSSPRKLDCPGEIEFAGRGVSYCATCDGPFFKNKKILVVGGGDSACDEATFLSTISDNVTVIHRRSEFRAQKAVAQRVLDNPKINVKFNTVVSQIQGNNKVESVILKNTITGTQEEISVDGVFIFVGAKPRTELMPFIKHDDEGYIITDENMATDIPGLFCAGDVRSKTFRQVVTAASDGAIAAHSAEKYILSLKNKAYN
ncbi:MAG: thioredoxin-disulfide reductase [Spirochaetaceae bacterium]|nr:thioredoxin-disulfide reductase [Spirochaetaceae bacterium]